MLWYYESNHQPAGPVDEAAIAELLKNGTITSLTLVWRDGMPDWKHLGETELSDLARKSTPAVPPMTAPSLNRYANPYASAGAPATTPTYNRAAYGAAQGTPRVRSAVLKRLFTWWLVLTGITVIYEIIITVNPSSATATALDCIGSVVALAAGVMNYVLLYRFWQVNQDGHASTTPGRAVGFMFIPIFQLYWIFRAFPGLSLDQNRYIADHFGNLPEGSMKKANPVIAFGYILFTFIGGLVMAILMFSKAASAMAISMDQLNPDTLLASFTTPMVIFTLIVMLLNIWMYYDFYKTAKSISEEEEKNA